MLLLVELQLGCWQYDLVWIALLASGRVADGCVDDVSKMSTHASDDKGKSKYVLVEPVVVGGKRPKGRPQQEFRHTLVDTIEDSCIIGSIDSLASLQLHAQQRGAFRRLLQEMVLKPPPPPAKPTRVQPSREAKTLANERMQEQLSG